MLASDPNCLSTVTTSFTARPVQQRVACPVAVLGSPLAGAALYTCTVHSYSTGMYGI